MIGDKSCNFCFQNHQKCVVSNWSHW